MWINEVILIILCNIINNNINESNINNVVMCVYY